jgi:prolyl-tRNA synthetase
MARESAITVKKSEDFSKWYSQVLLKSGFIDYSAVSGCIVFRPDAYFIWERIQEVVDQELKKIGVVNVYFPLFIPEKMLAKEEEHVEGFSPEVAWVTHAGRTKLDERLAIRPTSETIMYPSYAKWIRSWRDLPLRFNQWNCVVRWEFKHPIPLLRTREFLWNEGHTVFATKEEAEAEKDLILGIYKKVTEEWLALPGILGKKTEKEKFAGAVASYSIEHLLPDGKAIQGPDFHHDGQKFSRAFSITFLDRNKRKQYAWQNTWAITTREIGVMAAVHGDDRGLIIPPKVAPIQVVIVPIFDVKTKPKVLAEARKIEKRIKSKFQVKLDDREGFTPGWKFNEWELRGVPLRVEIGPKDIKRAEVVLVRRDSGEKLTARIKGLTAEIERVLNDIQKNLFERAERELKRNTHRVKSYAQFKSILKSKRGILQACWCGERACEDRVKEETGAKIINLPLKQGRPFASCIYCGKEARFIANFAKSY